MAIPRLADSIGVTPRVLRYWEEQGLISPTREHGKLRYSPRDLAIARLVKRLLETGVGIEGLRMLKTLSEREIRTASERGASGISLPRLKRQKPYSPTITSRLTAVANQSLRSWPIRHRSLAFAGWGPGMLGVVAESPVKM